MLFMLKRSFQRSFEILSATNSFRKNVKFHSEAEISKIENDVVKYNFIDLNI